MMVLEVSGISLVHNIVESTSLHIYVDGQFQII